MLKDKKPLTAVAYEYVYTNIINGVYSVNDIVSEGSLIQQPVSYTHLDVYKRQT